MKAEAVTSDLELFSRIRRNDDRAALNTLFSTYYRKLCVFASHFLMGSAQSEDAVSDVFFYLWKNRQSIDVQKNAKSYLYSCVRNECLAVLKKQHQRFVDIDDTDAAFPRDFNDPEQILTLRELSEQVDFIVDALPAKCRQIFIMSRYDGFTYKDIANILDIAEKTVENQLVKAISVLRSQLSEETAATR